MAIILGTIHNDIIHGGFENDVIIPSLGSDRMVGSLGSDIFVFTSPSDSLIGENRDVIADFEIRIDKIDVSAIDANVDVTGDQAFAFMGTAPPTGPGQITLLDGANGLTIVQLHTNNDAISDSGIGIDDGSVLASAYTASDFIL